MIIIGSNCSPKPKVCQIDDNCFAIPNVNCAAGQIEVQVPMTSPFSTCNTTKSICVADPQCQSDNVADCKIDEILTFNPDNLPATSK